MCAAATTVFDSEFPDPASDPAAMGSAASVSSLADEKRILWMCAGAMMLASADRTVFSLASLAIATDLGFGMSALGLLQAGPGRAPARSSARPLAVPYSPLPRTSCLFSSTASRV